MAAEPFVTEKIDEFLNIAREREVFSASEVVDMLLEIRHVNTAYYLVSTER